MAKFRRICDAPCFSDWFWERVERGSPSECWRWLQGKNHSGYGQCWDGTRNRIAHRVAWEVAVGPIPDGMQINHRCDNPPCCNPAHLYVGTQSQNIKDVVERRRRSWAGGKHPRAKLTDDQAREIRRRVADGETHRAVAADYGISPKTVPWVTTYGWKHLNNT